MIRRERVHLLAGALATVALAVLAVAAIAAPSAMQSTKLGPRLCETTGGGKFVRIPGFPGERVDRRLLTDIRWIEQPLPDLHHRRLLARPRARGERRAPDRARARHRPQHGRGRALVRHHGARPLGRAPPEPPADPVPLGRLQRRRRPRARQPPAPLLEPLHGAARPPGQDGRHGPLPDPLRHDGAARRPADARLHPRHHRPAVRRAPARIGAGAPTRAGAPATAARAGATASAATASAADSGAAPARAGTPAASGAAAAGSRPSGGISRSKAAPRRGRGRRGLRLLSSGAHGAPIQPAA